MDRIAIVFPYPNSRCVHSLHLKKRVLDLTLALQVVVKVSS